MMNHRRLGSAVIFLMITCGLGKADAAFLT